MSREGQKLGRYKLVRRKGAGGMAEVWEAYDEVLDRTVAVKVIGVSIAGEKEFRDRFLREARLAAKLEHKNILPIYDFGMQEDTAYLVMPLLPGGTLKERLQQPLTPEDVIDILASIGAALDHAHESGILHRDVKPSNVLVDKAGHLLLADFGLAKATEGTSGLTMTGAILGTPLYMPPEQAAGLPVDSRADQYSLGVIAYQV
ncbi:MAG: serine/threonine protein kinase, partial [Acidobacteria bacterium]|nr:serine/threonine protein kinase [Acidobacteriota bacterium]